MYAYPVFPRQSTSTRLLMAPSAEAKRLETVKGPNTTRRCWQRPVLLSAQTVMRERTLGNSVTQLYKKLMEQHGEAWTQRVLQYLSACEPFTRSSLVQRPVFAEPPLLSALPKPKWLLAVYARDVLGRLHEVKAKITSVLGCVLKMTPQKKYFCSALFISMHLPDTDMCVRIEHPFIFPNRSQRNLPVPQREQLPGAQMWETNTAKSLSLC